MQLNTETSGDTFEKIPEHITTTRLGVDLGNESGTF